MPYNKLANQNSYPFELPELPFEKNQLAPHFSGETFDYHHGKHHNAYVTKLNDLVSKNEKMQDITLEEVIITSHNIDDSIFNNAAQVWNHTFFWHSLAPNGGGKPTGKMLSQIERDFGSYEDFIAKFTEAATTQFASGWVWLVFEADHLQIIKTSNAETPVTRGVWPIITCDVWEHAYYIEYRNSRPNYVKSFFENMINWKFAENNLKSAL